MTKKTRMAQRTPEESVDAGIREAGERITRAEDAASGVLEGFNSIVRKSEEYIRGLDQNQARPHPFTFTHEMPLGSENYKLTASFQGASTRSITVTPEGKIFRGLSIINQDEALRQVAATAVQYGLLPCPA